MMATLCEKDIWLTHCLISCTICIYSMNEACIENSVNPLKTSLCISVTAILHLFSLIFVGLSGFA